MDAKIDAIAQELRRLKRAYRAQPYPLELRGRVRELARDWTGSGQSLRELGRVLRIRPVTLERWCGDTEDDAARPLPVRLVNAGGGARIATLTQPLVTVVSPSGWRLEGLRAADAIGLIARIG